MLVYSPTTESSDTVVFKDSSTMASSRPVPIEKGRRSRDRRNACSPELIRILYIQVGEWMDGWMDGWVDGWVGGWVGGRMDEWMGRWGREGMGVCVGGWMTE